MDPFEEDRPELTGSLISMEFGAGGRISQLWASDPALAEEGDEFQFVLPPITFGEESAEDYLPGTILLGARTDPDEPWILSRNGTAKSTGTDFEDENFDPSSVTFEYEFPLLEDIGATGRFFEVPGQIPQIVWEVEIRNQGRVSIEIGELGFPLAFNNLYDGFGWSDDQLTKLWKSRVYIHKFIGGGASWLFAQRMNAETPGLLAFPGESTSWEFYAHVRNSLNTPYQWEGIPVVYAHSKATIEREEWPNWMNEHTSLILEPRDSRRFQMRLVPCDSDRHDGVNQTLAICGKPAVRVFPGCVAPTDVGVGIEISGATPDRFYLSRDAQLESDSDEESAFCFVKPQESGPLHVGFKDSAGVPCWVHLMFTDSMQDLIHRRAQWIAENQVFNDPASPLHKAIVLTNIATGEKIVDPTEYAESSGIECALADALFLAEKNALYPDPAQIRILDDFINEFLLDEIQNPSSHAVASVLTDGGVGSYFGRPLGYPHVFNLYHAMYRIASASGDTAMKPRAYLNRACLTAHAMFEQGWRLYVRTVGVLGFARIYDLIEDLVKEGMTAEAEELSRCVRFKAGELMKLKFPYAGESVMDTSGMEEVFAAARFLADDDHLERTVRCAYASRSLAPSWWWYGSDKRSWDGADSTPLRALVDRGEACLAHTTIPNSLIFFGLMDRDYLAVPEAYMRMAFGGMLGPWALVRKDGAAAMCYCPDLSSKQAGFNVFTGASGLGYFHYLRGAGSYVLPNRSAGLFIFGCHYEADEQRHVIRPWDGVGRRIVMRQFGVQFELSFGRIVELRLDLHRRWFEMDIENPHSKDVRAWLKMTGLWGSIISVQGKSHEAQNGVTTCPVPLAGGKTVTIKGKVVR